MGVYNFKVENMLEVHWFNKLQVVGVKVKCFASIRP